MFDHTKDELSTKVADCNFIRDTIEKVMRLADILVFINEDRSHRESLHLKVALR